MSLKQFLCVLFAWVKGLMQQMQIPLSVQQKSKPTNKQIAHGHLGLKSSYGFAMHYRMNRPHSVKSSPTIGQ